MTILACNAYPGAWTMTCFSILLFQAFISGTLGTVVPYLPLAQNQFCCECSPRRNASSKSRHARAWQIRVDYITIAKSRAGQLVLGNSSNRDCHAVLAIGGFCTGKAISDNFLGEK